MYKVGDIVLFEPRGFVGYLINVGNLKEYGEKGPTHIGIICEIAEDHVVVAESRAKGFHKHSYTKLEMADLTQPQNNTVPKVQIKTLDRAYNVDPKKLNDIITKYIGREYGFLDIFYIMLYLKFGFKMPKRLRTRSKRLICSEAVARVFYELDKTINLEVEFNKPYDYLMPIEFKHSKHFKDYRWNEILSWRINNGIKQTNKTP